jgi:hypothetical protein
MGIQAIMGSLAFESYGQKNASYALLGRSEAGEMYYSVCFN